MFRLSHLKDMTSDMFLTRTIFVLAVLHATCVFVYKQDISDIVIASYMNKLAELWTLQSLHPVQYACGASQTSETNTV